MSLDRLTAAAALCALALTAAVTFGDAPPPAPSRPGVLGGGVTLLPNGWKIAPAGRHIQIGDLPLAMIESPDGKSLLVANNGYAKPTITVVDLDARVRRPRTCRSTTRGSGWRGIPMASGSTSRARGNNTVHEMHFEHGTVTRGVDLGARPSDGQAGVGAEPSRAGAAELHRRRRGQP